MENNVNQAQAGLNKDLTSHQLPEGILTDALNAVIEGFDGNIVTYQNENSNQLCITFPEGYRLVGFKNISQLERTIYFLTDPLTRNSQIGYSNHNSCTYVSIIDDTTATAENKLNFSIDHPIRKSPSVKTTNCSTQIYWTDNFNPRRFLDFDDLPWKEIIDPSNSYKTIKDVGNLDINKLLVQPNFSVPVITPITEDIGGSLKAGTYQFFFQYANALSEGYTSFYGDTNSLSIFENKITPNFDFETAKSITLSIHDIDTTGLYEHFNLVVVKTINNISTPELIGTFPIESKEFTYNYTGTEQSKANIQLSIAEILQQFPYYELAAGNTVVDNSLVWYDLKSEDEINYQQIWSMVKLQWETFQIPHNSFEAYNNGANTALYRGYMRDEVYPFEGRFILKNGKRTRAFHIPGRIATTFDKEPIGGQDTMFTETKCEDLEGQERWKVYNTASKIGYSNEYITKTEEDDCYVGAYEYGEFAFWESEEKYPNNALIWGNLHNQPIRHHKFPDSLVTHIHNNNPSAEKSFEHFIYPIGVKIDASSLYMALADSDLTPVQKASIQGFEILRGNRVNNKSVIAKGLFNNVGEYTYKDKSYYYANYPYNDLRPDPYFSSVELEAFRGFSESTRLEGFKDPARSRFTFYSPDTQFYKPTVSNNGLYVKMETIEYGKSYGHFVKVEDNAEHKFLTRKTIEGAAGLSAASGIILGAGMFGWPNYDASSIIPTFTAASELFEKLAPYTNFSYAFHSLGLYNNYVPIPNNGNKVRKINFAKYLNSDINSVESGRELNHFLRESSLYLAAERAILFPHEYDKTIIPEDDSRYIQSQNSSSLQDFYNSVDWTNIQDIIKIISLNDILQAVGLAYINRDQDVNYYQFSLVEMLETEPSLPVKGQSFDVVDSSGTTRTGIVVDFVVTSKVIFNIMEGNLVLDFGGKFDFSQFGTLNYVYVTGSPSGKKYKYSDWKELNAYFYIKQSFFTFDKIYEILVNKTFEEILLYKDTPYILSSQVHEPIAYYAFLIAANRVYGLRTELETQRDISSYYGAVKRVVPSQWGQIYGYETISTGYYANIEERDNNLPTIFGGDIYINRYALKNKTSIFNKNTVKLPNNTDINYNELGNYGYPMFWISTKPIRFDVELEPELAGLLDDLPGSGSTVMVIVNLVSGGIPGAVGLFKFLFKLFQQIKEKIGIKNINLDNASTIGITEQGMMYQFVYGIPYFFVESEVNVDHRQAYNEREGNFYPNVSGNIPDKWLQEVNVPIINDNTYTYNKTYSKQNKETFISHLREDFDPTKPCFVDFPNLAIYSDKSSTEEIKNNWLTYRPLARHFFPKDFGDLVSLDTLENNQVLVRFTNRTQIYNAFTTIDTSQPNALLLGNSKLFEAQPIDLTAIENGSAGSQHTFLIKTDYGHFFTDALRGQIIMLQGQKPVNIAAKGLDKWLQNNLPFQIARYFPTIDIDNHFNGIGLHGTYDHFFERVLFTKLDYKPLFPKKIFYSEGFYYDPISEDVSYEISDQSFKIELTDSLYFEDLSWTISFNLKTGSWVSYHSYKPNYYISYANSFDTGQGTQTWSHNTNITEHGNFYDIQYPYILEYPFKYKVADEILQSIKDYCSVRKYVTANIYAEPAEAIYFNKALIYNDSQCTGILNLIPTSTSDFSQRFNYPKFNADSKDILLSKSDNFFQFNTFWDIAKSTNTPFFEECNPYEKCLLPANLDYSSRDFKKGLIRGKQCKVRLILDNRKDVRLISRFIIQQTQLSYK